MLWLFAILSNVGQPLLPPSAAVLGDTAWIVSTVGHSEWCPAGNIRLDVRTGGYDFTPRASRRVCNDARLERPVRRGRLNAEDLTAVRAAYLRVFTEGLTKPVCANGERPETVIISNGGTPTLVVTNGATTASAPDELACWNDAANALHDVLDGLFSSAHQR